VGHPSRGGGHEWHNVGAAAAAMDDRKQWCLNISRKTVFFLIKMIEKAHNRVGETKAEKRAIQASGKLHSLTHLFAGCCFRLSPPRDHVSSSSTLPKFQYCRHSCHGLCRLIWFLVAALGRFVNGCFRLRLANTHCSNPCKRSGRGMLQCLQK
jgi:hypothetical protein